MTMSGMSGAERLGFHRRCIELRFYAQQVADEAILKVATAPPADAGRQPAA